MKPLQSIVKPAARTLRRTALTTVLFTAAIIGLATTARAQVFAPYVSAIYAVNGMAYQSGALFLATNLPVTVSSNSVVVSTNIVPLTKNCGLAISWRNQTSAGAGLAALHGSFSVDGTNFGCAPFWLGNPLSTNPPGNTVSAATNFSQAQITGFCAVMLDNLTNSGSGILTNLGAVINRPTLNTATY